MVFHSCQWDNLTEDQKTEQIIALRMRLKYKHDPEREKTTKLRQKSYGYPGSAGTLAAGLAEMLAHLKMHLILFSVAFTSNEKVGLKKVNT